MKKRAFGHVLWLVLSLLGFADIVGQTVTISSLSDNGPYCAGTSFTIDYTVSSQFPLFNTFTAQLSTSTGNFGSPVSIGSISSRNAGTINVTIPSNSVNGSQYRIRISSNWGATSATTAPLTINVPSISSHPSTGTQSVCVGASGTAISVVGATTSGSITGYQWYSNTTASNSGGTLIVGATGASYAPTSASAGVRYYYATATSSVGCTSAASNVSGAITHNAIPTIATTTPGGVCVSGTVTLGATASAGTVNWYSVASGSSSFATGNSYVTPTINTNTTYYVDATSNGCTTASRTAVTATIYTVPVINSVVDVAPTLCPSLANGTITIDATGSNLEYSINNGGAYQASNVFTGLSNGTYNIRVRVSTATSCFVNHSSAVTFNATCLTSGKCYDLLSFNSSKIVEVLDNSVATGADIVQRTYTSGPHQQWKLTAVGAYYRIDNVNSGLSAEVAGGTGTQGVHVTQNTYTGANYQLWTITNVSGLYTITNRQTGLLMDIEGASTADAVPLIQWPSNSQNNQKWNMSEVACQVPCSTLVNSTITPSATTTCTNTLVNVSVPDGGSSVSYLWTGTGLSSTTIRNPTITVGTAGTNAYTATATHTNGCKSTSSVNITFNSFTPAVSLATTASAICSGTSVTFTATASNLGGGTATYTFKNNGSTVQSGSSNTYATTTLTNGNAITVDISVSGGSCLTSTTATSNTINMSVTTRPAATISYAGTPFCRSVATGQAVTRTGTAGGTYSSTAGLVINSGTGDITPSTSTAGTYTVTYTMAATGNCPLQTATTSVTITTVPTTPTISYAGTPFCTNAGTGSVTQGGVAGGTYSSTAGLTINSGTGAITPSTSTGGTYTVTYSYSGGGCSASANASVTITTLPAATISYAGTPFCKSIATGQAVTRTGTAGGSYSSTAGLIINSSTGDITPSTSTAGTYTVTYTMAAGGGCTQQTATTSVTITTVPTTPTISYAGTPFCTNAGTGSVTQGGVAGGTYSSTAGLTINSSTGAITPSTSTGGTYTVTYSYSGGGCSASANTSVTITTLPAATISYAGTPFCSTVATGQAVTRTGTAGGTYSSTAGLTINSGTGDITPSTSTAGTYTVTYTMAAGGGCAQQTATTSVTITTLPAATISYAGTPFCSTVATGQAVTRTGTAGGTYSSTAGLTINSGTGDVTPSTSTAGTYTVTYTLAATGGCAQQTATTSVTITTLPAATISYSGTPFCTSLGTGQTVTRTGTAGGTYSSTAGLTINSGTGAITPSTSTAGTYTVTYTIAATGGCAQQTATTSVTITTLPAATISYAGTPFCSTVATGQAVTRTGTAGGTYSSTAGLTINSGTGDVTPSTSTAGTYTVTYTLAATGGCAQQTVTTSVTITTVQAATISYSTSPFCGNVVTGQTVTRTGTAGGTYSSTAGLTINSGSGTITPNTSTAGAYTVTYTMAATGGCAQQTATTSVTVTLVPVATISYVGTPFCSSDATDHAVTMTGTAGGVYSSTAGLTINSVTGDITPSTSTPGTYTVSYTIAAAGGCGVRVFNTSVTITTLPTATISYTGNPYCINNSALQSVTRTGTAGGTYSAMPVGLSINAASGQIRPSTSTAGTYTVTYTLAATGGCAQQTPSTTVTINPLASITSQPVASTTICSGGNATFSVSATGGGTLSYQWRRYGIDISDDAVYSGTNTPTLTLTGATTTHQGDFSVSVSATCGGTPVISNNANLVVNTAPNITSQPSFQTICEGGVITYEVVAFGGGLTYQWKADGVNISNGGVYSGATTSVLTLTGADVTYDGKMYSVVVSNGCMPNATSSSALLTVVGYVTPTVSISVNANDVCAGTSVSFTALPGGGGASPSYQWKVNSSNVGTNVNPYSTSALNNGDVVSVVMTSNGQCLTSPTAVSNNITMIVKPGIVNNIVGNDETLCYATVPMALVPTAAISGGTGTYTYQWQSSTDNVTFANIGGATSAGYAPGALTVNTWYRRLVSSGACNSASNSVHKLINTGSFIWVGNTSTDWNTASNWCNNAIPTASDDVTINAGTLHNPVIGSFTAYSNNLNLAPLSHLTLNDEAILEVKGHWVNAGTVVPEDGSTVKFTANTGTQTISGGSTPHLFFNLEKTAASTLQVVASSGVVIRRGGLLLISSGTFDLNNKSVLLKSKVSSTYVDSTASLGVVTGTILNASNFKVERYNTAKRGFRYVATSVQGITGNTFKDSVVIAGPQVGGFDAPYNSVATIKSFVESRAADWTKCFVSFANINTPIVPGKGYYLYVPAKRTTIFPANEPVTLLMTGAPQIGKVYFPLTYSPSASQGWNLLGNPYPSAIDWDHPTAWTKTNVNDAIYMWDPNIGTGAYYTYLAGVASDGRDNGSVISSGAGFFVRAQLSPALSVMESAKVIGNYPVANFRRAPVSYVTLKVTSPTGDVDYTTVRINDGSGQDQDALKLFNPKLNVYTAGTGTNELYAINAIDDTPTFEVPLFIKSSNATSSQIEVLKLQGAIGEGLKIKDLSSGVVWNLVQGLKFSLPAAGTQNLSLIKSLPSTDLSRRGGAESFEIYPSVATDALPILYSAGNIHKKIEVFKASGAKLATYETSDAEYSLRDFDAFASGVYTVKVSSAIQIETFKVVK